MRNRQTVEYLIYPRLYNAHSVLYKGTYCVSFLLYHTTRRKTTTYAYPFTTSSLALSPNLSALHSNGNFSFVTPKFEIVYEEERKLIDSHCVFRLQFERDKQYQVFLCVKLLRRATVVRSPEEAGFCVRQPAEGKLEVIDEQLIQVARKGFHSYERVVFRTSEFFSSVDFHIATFSYGLRRFRSKLQLSSFFVGVDLVKANPNQRLKEKTEAQKHSRAQDAAALKAQILSDIENGLPDTYRQLQFVIDEHQRLLAQYQQTALVVAKDQERRTLLPRPALTDLEYIKMKENVNLRTLEEHFSASSPEEILACILEQKDLVRKNIRKLREEFCRLLSVQTERQFMEQILHTQEEIQGAEERFFVRQVSDLTQLEGEDEARKHATEDFKQKRCVWNSKIKHAPLLYVQNHSLSERARRGKASSLTVFVHGYQGNSFDFQKAKNYLRKHNSHTHILIAESITNEMNQSIDSLGEKVAAEVTAYIDNSIFQFSLINFVGFSLGGLIARAALGKLQQYWERLNVFATFSSPHLGISEGENSLVNLGVWYLIKVDKVKNLKELNFQSVQFADSLLMRLSRCPALAHFKRVVLVCSKNDGFVPYYSTVLDPRNCQKKDIVELCHNITSQIAYLQRVEMVFDVQDSGTFDKLTGRKGHIQFLDNDYFLQLFFRLYGPAM